MISDTLIIDKGSCIGCGLCASVCIRDCIEIIDRKAVEVEGDCFFCYQCTGVCPKGAIRIRGKPDFEADGISKEPDMDYDDMMMFLRERRSIRWFTDEKVTRDEFDRLFEAGRYSPTAMHRQEVDFAVVDERLDEFMDMVYRSLKPIENSLPRIHQFCRYVEEGLQVNPKGHPLLWSGKQLIAVFAEEPVDAMIAMTRIELTAYSMGLGGFYSLFMNKAAEREPDMFSSFFSDIDPRKKLRCVFVIGHPKVRFRRTLPPRGLRVHYE